MSYRDITETEMMNWMFLYTTDIQIGLTAECPLGLKHFFCKVILLFIYSVRYEQHLPVAKIPSLWNKSKFGDVLILKGQQLFSATAPLYEHK